MSSDYVGIDVHRRRSQIAVVDRRGSVLVNRNVTNGVDTVLSVLGGLPAGTPVAFEAAYGQGRGDQVPPEPVLPAGARPLVGPQLLALKRNLEHRRRQREGERASAHAP